MSQASDVIRTMEFLFAKYGKQLDDEYARTPGSLVNRREDNAYRGWLTPEEHDQLYAVLQESKEPVKRLAVRLGRSHTLLWKIKRKQHQHYDPVRSERRS